MSLKSDSDRYGRVAIAFHWITAIMIIIMVGLGVNADNGHSDEVRRYLLLPHIILGFLTLILTLARIVWWWFFDRKPEPALGVPPLMARLARMSHILIYAMIIAVGASGMATNAMGGVMDAITSGAPMPSLDNVAPRRVHEVLAWTFKGLLTLHIAAALYHHFGRGDGTLKRMVGKPG